MIAHYHKLIYLMPLALLTGPFLPDLILLICVLFFLVDTFRYKLFSYFNNSFFKIFIFFFIIINISSFFSDNLLSFKYSFGYLRYGVFSIFVFYILKNFENIKFNFSYSILLTFTLLIIDGYIQLIFGKNIFLFEIQKYSSNLSYVTSFFNEEKKFGSYMARLFPLFIMSLILVSQKFKYKKNLTNILTILILLSCILVIFSTERVSIFIISIFLFCIFLKSKIFFKPKKLYFLVFIFIIFSLFYFNPSLFEKLKSVMYSSGLLFSGYTLEGKIVGGYDGQLYIFSKFHHDQIINSMDAFKNNTFFGIGPKNYKYIYSGWHPHNFHFQILAETGLFAYMIILSFFIFFSYNVSKFLFKKELNNNDEVYFLFLISFFTNLMPIPSGDFFNNWLNIILYLPVGFYLYFNEKKI